MTGTAAQAGEHTIGRWLTDRGRVTPHRIAIDGFAGELSYGELSSRAVDLAGRLHAAGARRGDRIATLCGNNADQVVLFFACASAGLVLAPLNWRLTPTELAYQMDDCAPLLVAVDAQHADLAESAVASAHGDAPRVPLGAEGIETAVPLIRRDGGRAGESGGAGDRAGAGESDGDGAGSVGGGVRDEDPLLLIYTSGTTGRPKGALLSHANCFWTNLSLELMTGMSGDDVVLALLPQFHVGGWNVQPLLAWWSGAKVVMPAGFDPAEALRLIAEKRVTTMMGVPATYQFLAEDPHFATTDLSSLRLAIVGGAPMPESLLHTWIGRGVRLTQGYGLTEAAPNVLCLPPEDATARLGWAGKPYPHVRTALGGREPGTLIDGAGVGELLVRGPNVFPGYHGMPGASADALRDGWLHTGDIAERDADGYYRLRGRLKDLYVSGGENVYPAEVESVLTAHPDIVEAAVIGVAHPRWGEAGHAVVVRRAGSELDTDAVRAFCRQRLAGFKVPATVDFTDALPRSGVGKIDKARLRHLHRQTGDET